MRSIPRDPDRFRDVPVYRGRFVSLAYRWRGVRVMDIDRLDWKAQWDARGLLVILNEFDAPEARNIAVVTGMGCNGNLRVRYLTSSKPAFECPPGPMTKVSDFAVHIKFEDGLAWPEILSGYAKAQYSDGKPRPWQGGVRAAKLATWAKRQRRFQAATEAADRDARLASPASTGGRDA